MALYNIPLHDLPSLVDGEGAFAGGEGEVAEVAAGALAGGFCPADGYSCYVKITVGSSTHRCLGTAAGLVKKRE